MIVKNLGNQTVQIHRSEGDFGHSGIQPRDVQHVADMVQQQAARRLHHPQIFGLLRPQRRGRQQIHRAHQAIQRRADFVAHHRQQFRFGLFAGKSVVARIGQPLFCRGFARHIAHERDPHAFRTHADLGHRQFQRKQTSVPAAGFDAETSDPVLGLRAVAAIRQDPKFLVVLNLLRQDQPADIPTHRLFLGIAENARSRGIEIGDQTVLVNDHHAVMRRGDDCIHAGQGCEFIRRSLPVGPVEPQQGHHHGGQQDDKAQSHRRRKNQSAPNFIAPSVRLDCEFFDPDQSQRARAAADAGDFTEQRHQAGAQPVLRAVDQRQHSALKTANFGQIFGKFWLIAEALESLTAL